MATNRSIKADGEVADFINKLTIEQLYKYFADPGYLRECLYSQYINGGVNLEELKAFVE